MTRRSQISALALAVALALPVQALAHASLKSATPADKAVVSAPSTLTLGFSEGVNLKFSTFKLGGSEKSPVETGEPSLADGGKSVTIPINVQLSPGAYTLDWNVLSVDGHKLKGRYTFTVKP